MFKWINTDLNELIRINNLKRIATKCADSLTLTQALAVLSTEEGYKDPTRRLGHYLSGHYLHRNGISCNGSFFPELYYENHDEVSRTMWNCFIGRLQSTLNYKN
jgi:hypothetical protein